MWFQGRTILSHDFVFWCGDFNYRIDLPSDEVKRLCDAQAWTELQESDQLCVQRKEGKVLHHSKKLFYIKKKQQNFNEFSCLYMICKSKVTKLHDFVVVQCR